MKALEKATAEISKGHLDGRVNISTGDEFEKLGQSFNSMAEGLSQSRDLLEERIKHATRELSEANLELQTLDKLKSDFLANMSHELRSPLTVIRGGVDYLNRTIKGSDNRKYLSIIDKNLGRLIHLVSDLFDFTKIEAGKADWTFEREDLSGLVQEVIDIVDPLAIDKNISIDYKYHKNIYAKMDLERIEQVLVNLIENAMKFSDPETEIQIEVKDFEDSVLVAVRDHGLGIPEEKLEVVFEKFHSLPSSGGGGKREGTGLGLAICKGIIEAHGGKIWAESVEGEGSVFFFTLPKYLMELKRRRSQKQ
jgi:signal transduction histidine kinase